MSLSSRRTKLHSSSSSTYTSINNTTSSTSSHKKEKKQRQEQVITPDVVEPPVITSPFERLDQVWALPTADKQRELVGQLFDIEDGPRMSLQALTLDQAFSHLLFAHQSGFSLDQTRVFYALLTQLRTQMSSPTATLPSVYASFRTYMLQHADIVRDPSQRTDPAVVASIEATNAIITSFQIPIRYQRPAQVLVINHNDEQDATRPTTAVAPVPTTTTDRPVSPAAISSPSSSRPALIKQKSSVSSNKNSNSNKKSTSPSPSTKRPSSRNKNHVEEEEQVVLPPAPKLLVGMYTLPQIQLITQYLTNGMFGHFELYQAVFNPELFQPRTRTITQPVHIETVVPDRLHLWDALDLEAEAKKERERQEQEQQTKDAAVSASDHLDNDAAHAQTQAQAQAQAQTQTQAPPRSSHGTSNSNSSLSNTASRSQSRTSSNKHDKDKDSNDTAKKLQDGVNVNVRSPGSHKKRVSVPAAVTVATPKV